MILLGLKIALWKRTIIFEKCRTMYIKQYRNCICRGIGKNPIEKHTFFFFWFYEDLLDFPHVLIRHNRELTADTMRMHYRSISRVLAAPRQLCGMMLPALKRAVRFCECQSAGNVRTLQPLCAHGWLSTMCMVHVQQYLHCSFMYMYNTYACMLREVVGRRRRRRMIMICHDGSSGRRYCAKNTYYTLENAARCVWLWYCTHLRKNNVMECTAVSTLLLILTGKEMNTTTVVSNWHRLPGWTEKRKERIV